MKKAILVVSFGTSYLEGIKKSICKIEETIADNFKEYDVFRAFTSHFIIEKLKEKHNLCINTPEEALEDLFNKGYQEVIVQPLHMIAGEEFQYIKNVLNTYKSKFGVIKLGRPIFYYQGEDDLPEDYTLFIKSIEDILNRNKATVLIGHGTVHPSTATYGCLQTVLENEGYKNVFIGTIEGYPGFNEVTNRVKRNNIEEVTLMPLLVVAGEHVKNDISSDDEDSWKSMFEREGIKVNIIMKGLGEYDEFNKLYINRINDLIENRYKGIGETKKGNENNNDII